jgi:hypothetical protein
MVGSMKYGVYTKAGGTGTSWIVPSGCGTFVGGTGTVCGDAIAAMDASMAIIVLIMYLISISLFYTHSP